MKACSSHREALAALAAAGGSGEPEPKLGAHLAVCPVCRRVAAETGDVARRITETAGALPKATLSPRALRAVAKTVRMSPRRGGRGTGAIAALAGLTVVIAALTWKPVNDLGGGRTRELVISKVDTTRRAAGREPRFGDYLSALRRSPEAFDALVDAASAPTAAGAGERVATLRAGSRLE